MLFLSDTLFIFKVKKLEELFLYSELGVHTNQTNISYGLLILHFRQSVILNEIILCQFDLQILLKKFFGLCWCLGNDIMEVLSPALSPLASSRDNQSNFQTPFFLRNISLKLLSGAEMKHNFLKLHMRKSTIHLARLKSILS